MCGANQGPRSVGPHEVIVGMLAHIVLVCLVTMSAAGEME